MTGWVAISRDIFEHAFFAREPMSEREAWVWMITRAAWENTRHKVGSEMVDVPRGSFFCTLRDMQVRWGWASDKRVRGFLERLEKEGMIGRSTGQKTDASRDAKKTQITICNYEDFQHYGRKVDAASDAAGTQPGRTKETREQETKVKEEEGKPSSKKIRASRLPADWFLPASWGVWALSEGLAPDEIRTEADKFRDYWNAKVKDAAKLDWLATWRNWVRTAKERKPQLLAINGGKNDRLKFDIAHKEYCRRLSAGEINLGPDPSDPFAGR